MKKLQEIIFRAFSLAITAVAVYVNIHFIKTTLVHFMQAARSSQSLMMLILGAGLIALTCAGFALGRDAKIAPDVSRQMDVLSEQNFNSALALESRRAGRPQAVAFAGRGSDLQQVHKSDPAGLSEPGLPAVVSATRTVVSAGWYGSRSSGEVFSSEAGVSANQANAVGSRLAPTGGLPSKVVISISEGAHSLAAQNQALEERRAEEIAAAGGERASKAPVAKPAKAFACSSQALG